MNDDEKGKELVSIICPSFNSDRFISVTIDSVLKQTYQNWELLITDDCSSDSTINIINAYAKRDDRVKLFRSEKNKGAACARNNSIDRAMGRYLAFLDSDDIWLPKKLEIQLGYMKENKLMFSFSAYRVMHENGEVTSKVVDLDSQDIVSYMDMLKKKATIGCLTVVLDSEVIKGKTMPDIRTGQDYAFWLSILRDDVYAHNLKKELGLYRIRKNSISRNKIKKAIRQWQIYTKIEKLSIPLAIWCFLNYAIRALFKF